MRKRFAGWVAVLVSSFSTICARACSLPDIYDPTLNPLYRDVLAHYGVVAMPCRVRDPDRKGKVESGVGHAQKTPLKGLRFESLEEAQAYLDHWERRWADTRIHGTTKRQVAAMFAEEKPFLLPLPLEPFRYYQYGERVVHLDGCVEVEAAYYGAAAGLDRTARPGAMGCAPRSHPRSRHPSTAARACTAETGSVSHQERGLPQENAAQYRAAVGRAARAGSHIGALCDAIHHEQGELGVRRILGVLSLAKKYGVSAVEDACAAALELGVHEYRFVRRYLERRPQLTLRQVDPLIRELTQYRDLINLKTKEQE